MGVLCGRESLMRRYRDDHPADICFARGTFNAHPAVMGAMNVFLERLDSPAIRACFEGVDERWNARATRMNRALAGAGLPLRVANLGSIWTVLFTEPSRYNWMLQYYLRAEGLALSWVGSGRLIFPIDMPEERFDIVVERVIAAGRAMQDGAWWRSRAGESNRDIRRSLLRELLIAR